MGAGEFVSTGVVERALAVIIDRRKKRG